MLCLLQLWFRAETEKKGGEKKCPCGLLPALQGPPQGKHDIQYLCFPLLLNQLQRLVQKLERTGIDLTSDGSGIDNWTLRNALLSWSALKIPTVRPSEEGVVTSKPLLNVWNAHSWLGSQAFWHHAVPHSHHVIKFHIGVDWLNLIDNWIVPLKTVVALIIQLKTSTTLNMDDGRKRASRGHLWWWNHSVYKDDQSHQHLEFMLLTQ